MGFNFWFKGLISYLILMPAIILWDAFSDPIDGCQCLVIYCSHNTLCAWPLSSICCLYWHSM